MPLSMGQLARPRKGSIVPREPAALRTMPEYQVRIREGLGVKFPPGPTRRITPSATSLDMKFGKKRSRMHEKDVKRVLFMQHLFGKQCPYV